MLRDDRVRGLAPSSPATGSTSAASRSTTPSTASGSRASRTSCGRRCSRSRSASSLDVVQRRPLGPRLPRTATTRSSTRSWPGTTACPSRRRPDEWVRVDDAHAVRARRAAADGGLPDQELARPAHQPGEARLLGRPPAARRAHPAAAAERARAARRRGQARRPDAARDAGPAPREHEPAPAATSGSTRSAWRSKATARSARRATQDLGGRPVDTGATFPGGSRGRRARRAARVPARTQRQDDFVDNLCRKLLAYALGRSLLPSDDADSSRRCARGSTADGYRFGSLVEAIVTSPQFLNKRVDADAREVNRR